MSDKSTERPAWYATINPPPRRRTPVADPPASPTPAAEAPVDPRPTMPAAPPPKRKTGSTRAKRQPSGSYPVGFGKPPAEHQFKKGNPGGPGRPKGSKSQDALLRAELSAKQSVRVGGRDRNFTKRQLLAKLLINTALEKRDLKSLIAVNSESRRLFPDLVEDVAAVPSRDPAADRRLLQQLMEHLAFGEPHPDGGDPLADLAIGGPDLGQASGGAWDEGDWKRAGPEANDDD